MIGAWTLAHPEVLGLLPVAALAFWLERRQGSARAAWRLRQGIAAGPRGAALLTFTALLLALIGLAGPRRAAEQPPAAADGFDLVLALDVSRSMGAQDSAPTRLARAKRAARELLEAARGERVTLVLFAGEGRVAVPRTRDHAALLGALAAADEWAVEIGGTDLAAALRASASALGLDAAPDGAAAQPRPAAGVLLLTDGEDHGEAWEAELDRLALQRVRVDTVLFGGWQGAPIPVFDGGRPRFLTEAQGQRVLTRRRAGPAAEFAARTGGRLHDGDRWRLGVEEQEIEPADSDERTAPSAAREAEALVSSLRRAAAPGRDGERAPRPGGWALLAAALGLLTLRLAWIGGARP